MVINRVFISRKFPPETKWDYRIGYIDGVPFYESEYNHLINSRNVEDYGKIKSWVDIELMPYMTRKTINDRHSSYGLKHIAENEIGFYVCNSDIKLILLENGVPFKKYPGSPNVVYPLSQMFYNNRQRRGW